MLKRSWPLLVIFLTVSTCVFFQLSLLRDTESKLSVWSQADSQLRKILLVAYGLWQEHGELNEANVWQKLGHHDALKDPWGQPYHLKASPIALQARSSGPDAVLGNEDDLSVTIPRDLPQPSTTNTNAPPPDDAKSSGRAAQ